MRRILVAAVAFAVLAVAGCTDDPQPRFEEPSESPSATEPTATASPEPEPWEKKSKAGAVAFARHWVNVFNRAQSTGDTAALEESSDPACKTCDGFVRQLDKLYEEGGRFESKGWRVLLASPGPRAVTDTAQVNLRVFRPPESVIEGDGRIKRFAGGNTTFSAELSWTAGEWKMARLVRFA